MERDPQKAKHKLIQTADALLRVCTMPNWETSSFIFTIAALYMYIPFERHNANESSRNQHMNLLANNMRARKIVRMELIECFASIFRTSMKIGKKTKISKHTPLVLRHVETMFKHSRWPSLAAHTSANTFYFSVRYLIFEVSRDSVFTFARRYRNSCTWRGCRTTFNILSLKTLRRPLNRDKVVSQNEQQYLRYKKFLARAKKNCSVQQIAKLKSKKKSRRLFRCRMIIMLQSAAATTLHTLERRRDEPTKKRQLMQAYYKKLWFGN